MNHGQTTVNRLGQCGVVGDVCSTEDFADPTLGDAVVDPVLKVVTVTHGSSSP